MYFLTRQRPDTIAVFGRNNESLLSIFGQPKAFWEQSGVCSDNSELEQHQSVFSHGSGHAVQIKFVDPTIVNSKD